MDFIFPWIVAFVLGFWIFKKINRWKELPPGPWGLPIIGYLPFIDRHYPHVTLTELSKQYGPIYGIQMGSIYTIVLSDHRLIREAFSKDVFAGRAPLFLTHGIMKGNGLIAAEGPLWKDQRKLTTSWLKSFGMSKHSVSRDKLAKRISTGVYELIQNVKDARGSPVFLPNMVGNCLGNVINEIIFGFKFPLEDKTFNWFNQIQQEGCHELGVAGAVNFLPFMRFLSNSAQKTLQLVGRGQAQTHRLYASIIATRRKILGLEMPAKAQYPEHANIFDDHPEGFIECIKYSTHGSKPESHYFDPKVLIPSTDECILDKFLEEQKRRYENGEENAYFMRDEQLLYLLADLFGAGLDTTSVSIAWMILYISLHTELQEKLREEILTVYPEECEVDNSKLPKLMAVVCEVQRIRSIVPLGIPHGSMEDSFLGNYRIPKGAMLIPLQWAVHMDANVWENPNVFNPNRFIDEYGELLKPQEFIPFQTGKRMCPGDELSRMLTVGFMSRLLREFRIRLSSDPPTPEEMKGEIGLVLTPPKVQYICEPVH